MDSNTLKILQVLAIKATEDPSFEDFIEKVQRWYSKTFSTPLTEVEGMSDEKLVETYLKEKYLDLYDSSDEKEYQRYLDIRELIVSSFDEVEAEQVEAEDEDWAAQEIASAEEKWVKDLNSLDTKKKPIEAKPQVPNLIEDSGSVAGEDSIPED